MVLELIHPDGRRVSALEVAQKARRLCRRAGIVCPMVSEIVEAVKALDNDEERPLLLFGGYENGGKKRGSGCQG